MKIDVFKIISGIVLLLCGGGLILIQVLSYPYLAVIFITPFSFRVVIVVSFVLAIIYLGYRLFKKGLILLGVVKLKGK
jgi:hypothetical protein